MGVCSPPASPLGRWGNKACKGDLQIVVIIAAAALLAAVCLAVKPAGKPDGGERFLGIALDRIGKCQAMCDFARCLADTPGAATCLTSSAPPPACK